MIQIRLRRLLKLSSLGRGRLRIPLALALLSCELESAQWGIEECSTTASFAFSSSNKLEADYCRAQAFADPGNTDGTSLDIQWMSDPSTDGFNTLGADFTGSLVLSINDAGVVEVGFPIRISADCPDLAEGLCATLKFYAASGVILFVSGRVDLDSYEFSPHGDGNSSSKLYLSGKVAARAADGSTLTGNFSVRAAGEESSSTGNGTGTGSGSCSDNNCSQFCTQGAIAGCYCAAACACHYCGDNACESANRKYAQDLGTICSY